MIDFPIEMNHVTENKNEENNSNNLYYRYYVCIQKIGEIECIKCDNYEKVEEISKSNNLYLTKECRKEHTNGVFPVHNLLSTSFKICKFIPTMFDKLILKYELFTLMHVNVKKIKQITFSSNEK